MAGTFDDIPKVASPPSVPPPTAGRGTFDDIPMAGETPPPPQTWGQWARSLVTGEGRIEHPGLEEFHVAMRRAGVTPEQAQAQPRGREPQTFLEHVRRALGSTEFEAPPAPPGQNYDPTAVVRAGITPDPKAQLDILRRNIPGLESQTDRYGNIMLRAPSVGVNDWTYLNRPGLSAKDWEEIGTQTLATLPFGAVVGLGRNLAARAAIGGAALGGSSLAQDAAATAMGSEQGFDPTRAAISAGFGTLAGPLAGWLAARAAQAPTPLAAQRAAQIGEDIAAHERLGVRTFGPAFSQGPIASVAKQLSETPVIGGPVRRALEESISETGRATEDIAGRFGAAATADEAGLVAREALDRFRDARPADVIQTAAQGMTPAQRAAVIAAPVRETSLRTKQAALYEQAWSRIPPDMQQGASVQGLPRVLGQMSETRNVLEDIANRNTRMVVAGGADTINRTLPGGFLGRVIDAIRNPNWRAALQTMRDIRSDFRRMQSGIAQTEGAVLRHSDIDRIESAITRDMINLLQRNVGRYTQLGQPQVAANIRRAITEFGRADQFTRLAMQRMDTIERLFNADNATALYRNIAQAALGGTRGDVNKLRVLVRTLRRPEMDEIASYVLRAMGEPVASARGYIQEIGFSPSSFMTRLQNMQPEAAQILFGHAHVQALNDLGRVVNRLANVEALVNTSRSGTNALNLGGMLAGGSALATGQWEAALAPLAIGSASAVLFSRPSYVRWVQGYAQLRAAAAIAPQRFGPALTRHIARLEAMAASDPTLLPVVRSLRASHADDNGTAGNPPEAQ